MSSFFIYCTVFLGWNDFSLHVSAISGFFWQLVNGQVTWNRTFCRNKRYECLKWERKKEGGGGYGPESSPSEGTLCDKVMPPRKQMSPHTGSRNIKISGWQCHQTTISGDGPLWMNYWPSPAARRMGFLCECQVSSCVSVKSARLPLSRSRPPLWHYSPSAEGGGLCLGDAVGLIRCLADGVGEERKGPRLRWLQWVFTLKNQTSERVSFPPARTLTLPPKKFQTLGTYLLNKWTKGIAELKVAAGEGALEIKAKPWRRRIPPAFQPRVGRGWHVERCGWRPCIWMVQWNQMGQRRQQCQGEQTPARAGEVVIKAPCPHFWWRLRDLTKMTGAHTTSPLPCSGGGGWCRIRRW